MGSNSSRNHDKHYQKNKRKILVLGVENSGKTNLCRRLVDGSFLYDHIPTEQPKEYKIHYQNQEWTLVDIGGSERSRMHWKAHILGAHAIIFMVDVSDPAKFQDVKMELDGLVANQQIKSSVVFILLNKRDLIKERYINENDILLKINISNRTFQEFNIKRQVVSILTGEGVESAFTKLHHAMNEHIAKFL